MPAYKDGRAVLGNLIANTATGTGSDGLKLARYSVNIPQLMSQMNSKNHEHTDRDGHVKAFPFQLQVLAASPGGVNLYVTEARNTWKFRNSFRKWHALRMHMFREAGITKSEMGTYGQTLRPYWDRYDQNMLAGNKSQEVYGYWSGTTASLTWNAQANYLTPAPYIAVTPATGEWTHSQFGTVPLYDNTAATGSGTAGLPIMDEWDVHIIGETVIDASASVGDTVTYTSVGMLHAYNLDRMEAMPDAVSGTTVEGPNNPLAALAVSGNQAAGAILDIAEDQELDLPPYDTRDDGYSIDITATTTGVATTGTIDGRAVFNGMAAGGLFSFSVDADCYVTIDCQGEYLCKDY